MNVRPLNGTSQQRWDVSGWPGTPVTGVDGKGIVDKNCLMIKNTDLSVDQEALHAEIASLKAQLQEARDEAELNLLQLQQVQEELEYYFQSNQDLQLQLEQHQQEEWRAEVLIMALLERIEAARF